MSSLKKKHQEWLDSFLNNCLISNRSNHTIINYRADLIKFIAWFEVYYPKINLNKANASVISDYKNFLSSGEGSPSTINDDARTRISAKITTFILRLFSKESNSPPEMLAQLRAKALAVSSRRRHLSAIKNFYDYLKQANEDSNKLFENNPVKPKLHGVKLKDEDVEHTALLTKKDWDAIIEFVYTPRDRLLVHLMYYAGMRLGEICALKVSNFDLSNQLITFVRKGGYVHKLYPQKTDLIFELLALHLKTRAHSSDYLFTNKMGTKITSRGMYNRIIKIFRKSMCPSDELTPHSFRKACATNLYEQTKDLLFVRDYLNHSDAKVTQTYIEILEGGKDKIKLNKLG